MREVFGRFQYSIVFLLYCALLVIGLRNKRSFLFWAFLAGNTFIFCAASISKLPYAYFLFTSALILMMNTFMSKRLRTGRYVFIGLAGILALVAMHMLYALQYKDNPNFDPRTIGETIAFRMLRAYPDGYKLYLELYPEVYPYNFGRTTSLLEPAVGYSEQPYILIPQYFGAHGTSFPSGFASYAYASFGMVGVAITSGLVGIMLIALDMFVLTRRRMEFRQIARAALGMGTFWFCSLAFTTSLLSGGLLLIPLIIVAYERLMLNAKLERRL